MEEANKPLCSFIPAGVKIYVTAAGLAYEEDDYPETEKITGDYIVATCNTTIEEVKSFAGLAPLHDIADYLDIDYGDW
jgi:hypothetical protein